MSSIIPVQSMDFETDYLPHVLTVLRTVAEIAFRPPQHESAKKVCVLALRHYNDGLFRDGAEYHPKTYERGKPRYLHVCTLFDYRDDVNKGDESAPDLVSEAYNYGMIIEHVHKLLLPLTFNDLKRTCGDGYSQDFMHFDGSISLGYKITHRPSGGWNLIDVSLCHIYYGK
jgi:hypothetical protein